MDKKAYILVVDDDPDILDTSRIILEKHGYEVQTAKDGKRPWVAWNNAHRI